MTDPLDWSHDSATAAEVAYDECAAIYDLGIGRRLIDLEFYVGEARRVLDQGGEMIELGTGTGRMAERLVLAGFRVLGVDISARMLDIAARRAACLDGKYRTLRADMRSLTLAEASPLVIAPFGAMAHLLTDADQEATLRSVFALLAPGGTFLFDDSPTWLHPPDSTRLERVYEEVDPATGHTVRLMTNAVDLAGGTLNLSYYFLDQLEGTRLVSRAVTRLVFNNPPLADHLARLTEIGFDRIEVLGSFDGRPFVPGDRVVNERFIVRCRKPG